MYLALSLENMVTVGVILLIRMLAIHVLAQVGLNVASLWGG